MSGVQTLDHEDGWRYIQADPRRLSNARRTLNSAARYNKDAGQMVKYLAEFVGMACAPDMLAMRLFPNGKEITESFAAFDAVRYRLPQFVLSDPSITLVAVGDGQTPRTAATFAMRSAWQCYSVDPEARGGIKRWAAIRRLTVLPKRIEDVQIAGERVVVVAVHSHAKLSKVLRSITARELAIVAMPCCVPQILGTEPDVEYADKGVISPCRTIRIWRDVTQAGRCPVGAHNPNATGSTPVPATIVGRKAAS